MNLFCSTDQLDHGFSGLIQLFILVNVFGRRCSENLAWTNTAQNIFICLIRIENDEQITIISFIGNSGGLLGLFLGLSFVSLFEVVIVVVDVVLSRVFDAAGKLTKPNPRRKTPELGLNPEKS